ncbi:MAG TPA: YdeI/OmpD-associated family protein, partial [Bacteroidales bacterium]|nr:YdeI/OmpD-associated family protein [Bacteroidales bacterium]
FKDQNEFREWLEKNHKKESQIIVGFYKLKTDRSAMTWSQSVDQALCFGWIDGIRRSVDNDRYCIRFTPRNPKSAWSNINIKKVEDLTKRGLMKEEGLEIFNKRKVSRSGIYSFEQDISRLSDDLETIFNSNKKAREFFNKQSPSYKRTMTHWIMSAKQEKTRTDRLNKLIEASANQKRLY